MEKIKNHYKTLEVSPAASAQEILRARNRLLKSCHPDLNPELPGAKEKTIDVVLAALAVLAPLYIVWRSNI